MRVGVFRVGGDDFRLDLKGFSPNLASWRVFCCSLVGYLRTSEVNFAAHKSISLAKLFRKREHVLGFPQHGVNTKKNRGEIPCKTAKKLNSNHSSKAQW